MAGGPCVDLWRRRRIEHAWLDTLAAQQPIVLEVLHEIDRLLRSLPVKAAHAFVSVTGSGMSENEVAAEPGVSTRMVRKYIAQAMLYCLKVR